MVKILKKTGTILAAGLLVFTLPQNVLAEDAAEEKLQSNQRKAIIQVVSITGNEMTYIEKETEAESAAMSRKISISRPPEIFKIADILSSGCRRS